ncbi:hypothetical protein M0R45_024709 [Rubus argutus]|uniref:Bifunctional inhibitor/plant lipid transfer protein/seed storage helical domain-containing protein n=1 Tax=Rubus argutus TaxID=59490 RepID=A0AAW1WTH1_RUBAR
MGSKATAVFFIFLICMAIPQILPTKNHRPLNTHHTTEVEAEAVAVAVEEEVEVPQKVPRHPKNPPVVVSPPIITPPITNPPVTIPPPSSSYPPYPGNPPSGRCGGCGGGGGSGKHPPPPPPPATCPIDALKLGLCVDVLGGLVHIGLGNPVENACCPVLGGLLELEAAICLCTTIRLKLLNLNIFIPLALQALITCGITPPPGFVCPPL